MYYVFLVFFIKPSILQNDILHFSDLFYILQITHGTIADFPEIFNRLYPQFSTNKIKINQDKKINKPQIFFFFVTEFIKRIQILLFHYYCFNLVLLSYCLN